MKYKEIEKEYSNLGELLSSVSKQLHDDWDKNKKFFEGIEYDSWEEFESAIKELNKYLKDNKISSDVKPLLYRGQHCGKWDLKTTLERYTKKKYTVMDYLELIQSAKWVFSSHFDKGYEADEINFRKVKFELNAPHPYYQLLSYFRHLGLPSPLLDWTRSFYVAAYFAFSNAVPEKSKFVAIYTYKEYFGESKEIDLKWFIGTLGPNIPTHKRHYLQQAEYTYALSINEESLDKGKIDCNEVTYFSHDDAIEESMSEIGNQDICAKHLIPATEKNKALKYLHSLNINEYSLFHTEESLMKTVAYERIRR